MALWDAERGACPERRAPLRLGDHLILYGGRERLMYITLEHNQCVNHKFGLFRHNAIVGKYYGDRIYAERGVNRNRGGFLTMMRPTPELWRLGPINRRTQILFTRDISHVRFMLELAPGKIVLESGTGSGSFSMSLARAVAPTGRVRSFEFHEARAEKARKMFANLGLQEIVSVEHRDVCGLGFGVEKGSADAVFLDLPSPATVIGFVRDALKPYAPMCSFSPCIEQVGRTCEELRRLGFTDITTIECLLTTVEPHLRAHVYREGEFERLATGHRQRPVHEDRIGSPNEESNGGDDEGTDDAADGAAVLGKRARGDGTGDGSDGDCEEEREGEPQGEGRDVRDGEGDGDGDGKEEGGGDAAARSFAAGRLALPSEPRRFLTRNVGEQRGHTSFLTFARSPPAPAHTS